MKKYICDKCGKDVGTSSNNELRGGLIGGVMYTIDMSFTETSKSHPGDRVRIYKDLCGFCMVELLTIISENKRKVLHQDLLDVDDNTR